MCAAVTDVSLQRCASVTDQGQVSRAITKTARTTTGRLRDEGLATALRAKGAEVVTGAMTKRVNTVVWDDTKGKAKGAKVVAAEAKGLAVWARSEAGRK